MTSHDSSGPKTLRPAAADRDPWLVDSREAARLLNVSERALWELGVTGKLPRVRVGRSVRFDLADLRNFIDSQKRGGGR